MRIGKIFAKQGQHDDGLKGTNFKLVHGNPGILTATLFLQKVI